MSEPLPVDIRFQWRATNFAINDPEKCTQYIGPEMTDINMDKNHKSGFLLYTKQIFTLLVKAFLVLVIFSVTYPSHQCDWGPRPHEKVIHD